MNSRSTAAKVGLVVLVVLAGVTALAANFGILRADRPSPEVGVLSATDAANTAPFDPAATAAPAVARSTTTSTARGPRGRSHDDRHDGGSKHDGDHDADD